MKYKLLKILVILTIILANIGCDQATKYYVKNSLERHTTFNIVGNLFLIRYSENNGGFLGLGSNLPPSIKPALLVTIPAFALLALLVFIFYNSIHRNRITKINLFAYCFVIGGGFGNIIDRVLNNGSVVDFMNFGIGELRTGILNFADLSLSLGIAIIIVDTIRTILLEKRAERAPAE